MTTETLPRAQSGQPTDQLSGTPRAGVIDRWIYVAMAVLFVVGVLAGFVPDSIGKMAAVEAGQRPPFPMILHAHAVLMGAFLVLLLAQTVLVALGRTAQHRKLGLASLVVAPALVVVGFLLVPTMYHQLWDGAHGPVPPPVKAELMKLISNSENIMLLQFEVGLLFPLMLTIGLLARHTDAGLHKRMMILSIAPALAAAFDRITWLPTSLPESPTTAFAWPLAAVLPMFLWDVIRNRRVHRAYGIWLAIFLPVAVIIHLLWDTSWWHQTAQSLMGV